MKISGVINKQLCISGFMVQLSTYELTHRFDAQSGKTNNSFGYIESGSVEFNTLTGKVTAESGDFIFTPESLRYYSLWQGSDSIRFYSLHFRSEITEAPFWATLALQKIAPLSGGATGERVKELFRLSQGNEVDQLKAYSEFYGLAAEALPYMKTSSSVSLPEGLRTAVSYIEKHCAEIGSVAEIAAACYISESALYHLFRQYLHTTPITYLNRNRILLALEYIKRSDDSIGSIAERLNFHSEYYFRETFRRITGKLPSDFRKDRRGSNNPQ